MSSMREAQENLTQRCLELRNAVFGLMSADEDVVIENVLETRFARQQMTQREKKGIRVETKLRVKYISSVIVNAYVLSWEDRVSDKAVANYMYGHVVEVNTTNTAQPSTGFPQEFEIHSASAEELTSAQRLKMAIKFHIWALRIHDEYEAEIAAFDA